MKTTIEFDDELLREAKRRAAAAGITLKALVEEALRARLLDQPRDEDPFELDLPVVHGDRPPAVDIADRRELYDFMERDRDRN